MKDIGSIEVHVRMTKHGEPGFEEDVAFYNMLAIAVRETAERVAELMHRTDDIVVFT